MRLFVFLCLVSVTSAGLFSWFGGGSSKKEPEKVIEIRPDPGELVPVRTDINKGKGISVASGDSPVGLGDEIFIDDNLKKTTTTTQRPTTTRKPTTTTTTPAPTTTTTTYRPPIRTTPFARFDTSTFRVPLHEVTREIPSRSWNNDRCPQGVDAFTPGPFSHLLFDGQQVFEIEDRRVLGVHHINELFPDGPSRVTAAVYDESNELLVIFNGRQVYAYGKTSSRDRFQLQGEYPKSLTTSINFTPTSAVRWHDKHQLVLTDLGAFALYDQYWNKSLMAGNTKNYFQGLPDQVRGISEWRQGRATIYSPRLVFQYDQAYKAIVEDGIPLSSYLQC